MILGIVASSRSAAPSSYVFEYTATLAVSYNIKVKGTGTVYWGDGTNSSYDNATTEVDLVKDYSGDPITAQKIQFDGTLTWFYSVTELTSTNQISFDVADLPNTVTYLNAIYGERNFVSGTIANLPTALTYLGLGGGNTVSGDIADIPSGLTYYNLAGSNTVSTYTSGHTFNSGITYFRHISVTGNLSSTELDNLFNDMDTSSVGVSLSTIYIDNQFGTDIFRTSASSEAIFNIKDRGTSTVTILPTYEPTNLVSNGTFTTDTVWTKQGTWAIAGGVASCGPTEGAQIRQQPTFSAGDYLVTITVVTATAGDVRVRINDSAYGPNLDTASATPYVFVYTAGVGSGWFDIDGLGFTGSVDDVFVEALP